MKGSAIVIVFWFILRRKVRRKSTANYLAMEVRDVSLTLRIVVTSNSLLRARRRACLLLAEVTFLSQCLLYPLGFWRRETMDQQKCCRSAGGRSGGLIGRAYRSLG